MGADVDFLLWAAKEEKIDAADKAWKSCMAATGMLLSKGKTGQIRMVLLSLGAVFYTWPMARSRVGKSTVWSLAQGESGSLRCSGSHTHS